MIWESDSKRKFFRERELESQDPLGKVDAPMLKPFRKDSCTLLGVVGGRNWPGDLGKALLAGPPMPFTSDQTAFPLVLLVLEGG